MCPHIHCLFRCHYRPQRSCGQGYVFTRVCDSVNRGGGVCLSACWDTTPSPLEQTHPREQTPPPQSRYPPKQTPPPPRSRHRHTVNERPVRILLECILVGIVICKQLFLITIFDVWRLQNFIRVKHLWVMKFHKNNAFSAIASNGIIFEILRNFNTLVFNYY